MCVEIFEDNRARRLQELLTDCDCIRFSDGNWYKFTKKAATKEQAIRKVCAVCGIKTEEIVAFGDDYADIGMLELCGTGIAMGNAIDIRLCRSVKTMAPVLLKWHNKMI